MTSSKLYFVALLIILSALVSSVQSIRKFSFPHSILFLFYIKSFVSYIYTFNVLVANSGIMDASSDCDFRGPCKKKEDCYARCEVDRPPFNNATCVHKGSSRQCCCILS